MGEKKLPIPGESSGLIVMTEDQLISVMRKAFPGLANGTPQEKEFLDLEDARVLLGVKTIKTVRDYVNHKGLPARQIPGTTALRLKRSEVIAWLDAQAVKPGAHVDKNVKRLKRARGE